MAGFVAPGHERPAFGRQTGLIRPGRAALLLAWATILFRCFLLLHNYTPEKIQEPDSPTYERPALTLLTTGRFVEAREYPEFFARLYGSSPSTEPRPMFLRSPGYPLFIAAIYRLGADSRSLIVVQIFISGIAVWLTYLLGDWLFSAWAGVVAALLVAIDPATVWCAQAILTDTLFTILGIGAVLLGVAFLRRPAWRTAILLGTLLGVATLVKPVAYYLPIPICAVLLFGGAPKRFLAGILTPVVLLAGCWQVRNLNVLGTSAFAGIGSVNLLLWRAAGIVMQQQGIDLDAAQKQVIHMVPDPAQLSVAELNNAFFSAALQVIRAHPILYLRDMVKGLVVVLVSPGARSLPGHFGLPPIPFVVGYVLFLLLVYAASLIQAAAMWGKRMTAIPALAAVVAIYLVVLQAGADSSCRYRVAAMPFFAVYAGAGILRTIRSRGGSSSIQTP